MYALLTLLGCPTAPPPCEADLDAWADEDGDGYGGASLGKVCKLEKGQVDQPYDCDDQDELLSPDHVEACDGIDNDCDGHVDEDTNIKQFWRDDDGDSFGGLFPSQLACSKPGDEWVANSDDCDDGDAGVSPDAQEICGRIDEDCDGYIDESDDSVDPASFSVFHRDADGDGFGDPDTTIERCRLIPGYVIGGLDCDDTTSSITRYDFFEDADGDGYGDPATGVSLCERPPGTVRNDQDCDDADPAINIDRDWFEDVDGDGFGAGLALAYQCSPPQLGAVAVDGDCDDGDPGISPDASDTCLDGFDMNCDGNDNCRTCAEWLAYDPASPSGVYTLTIDTTPYDVFCDMTTDGGGWTLVTSTRWNPPDDIAGAWHNELDTLAPGSGHYSVWDGLRPVITGATDVRFACKQNISGAMTVDLSFYDVPWYLDITAGPYDSDTCFAEGNGAGAPNPPPARRNNVNGASRALGDQWNSGYLEGEDSCSDGGDFAVDFDDRGVQGNGNDGTDWGESGYAYRCGQTYYGTAWFVFVRE